MKAIELLKQWNMGTTREEPFGHHEILKDAILELYESMESLKKALAAEPLTRIDYTRLEELSFNKGYSFATGNLEEVKDFQDKIDEITPGKTEA